MENLPVFSSEFCSSTKKGQQRRQRKVAGKRNKVLKLERKKLVAGFSWERLPEAHTGSEIDNQGSKADPEVSTKSHRLAVHSYTCPRSQHSGG